MSLRAAQILLLSTKKILVINPRKNITRSFQIDSGHFIGQWYVYVYYVPYVRCTIVFTLNISKKNTFYDNFMTNMPQQQ